MLNNPSIQERPIIYSLNHQMTMVETSLEEFVPPGRSTTFTKSDGNPLLKYQSIQWRIKLRTLSDHLGIVASKFTSLVPQRIHILDGGVKYGGCHKTLLLRRVLLPTSAFLSHDVNGVEEDPGLITLLELQVEPHEHLLLFSSYGMNLDRTSLQESLCYSCFFPPTSSSRESALDGFVFALPESALVI